MTARRPLAPSPRNHLVNALKAIREEGEAAAERSARFPAEVELFGPPPAVEAALDALCEALGEPPVSPAAWAYAAYYASLRR